MSTIQLKRSSAPGKIPVISQLVFGELALNYADGILYYKDADNTVQSLNSNAINGDITLSDGTTLGIPEGEGTVGFVCTDDSQFLIETRTSGNDTNVWSFGADANLTLPDNGIITFDRNNTSISVGMGFHIRSGEGVSLEAVDQADSENLITRGWYVGSDGTLNASNGNYYYARAYITLINFPAQDSGFGLTTPDGVTHDFKYDYDGSFGAETPILIVPGTDSIQTVATKTIVVLNNSGLFGNIRWDSANNCIWIYQSQIGINGNQQNYAYGSTDGISSFTGAANGSIVFGDGSIQDTAYTPDNQLIHQWNSPNNVVWQVKQYNGGFSGTYVSGADPLLWWDAADIPGLSGNNVSNFRGAIVEYHAFVNGKTVIGSVWIASDNSNSADLTQVANGVNVFAGNQTNFAGLHFNNPWNSNTPENPIARMSHQLGYYNENLTEGQSDNLRIMWTSRVFVGGEFYC